MDRADAVVPEAVAATRVEPEAVARLRGSRSPPGRLLGNGRFLALATEAGTGGAWLEACALSRWRGDRVEDPDGCFVYLRDDDGRFWSAGLRPVAGSPERYEVEHEPGRLGILREEHGVEARMETWVDAGADLECRRLVLRNVSARSRTIEVTTWIEVVLDTPRAFEAHPAFSRLFLQTEALAGEGILLARRRPRDPHGVRPWLAHALLGPGPVEFETDRCRFLGRGRDPGRPRALVAPGPLSGAQGSVLDPVLCLRRRVTLAPRAHQEFVFALAAAPDREDAVARLARLHDPAAIRASRAAAEANARERARRHGLTAGEAMELERIGAALAYGDPRLAALPGREPGAPSVPPADTGLALPPGIPLVLVEDADRAGLWKQAEAAWAYWRDLGFTTALIGSARSGLRSMLEVADASQPRLIARSALSPARRRALAAAAPMVVRERWPRLEEDAHALAEAEGGAASADGAAEAGGPALEPESELIAGNGCGGFTPDGSEYVIRLDLEPDGTPRLPPLPWVNVLAGQEFGSIVSETGACCTWSRNSREHRLTPWSNDPVRDPHGEALYVRDEAGGDVWSPLPGPRPGPGAYEARHGFGYSRFRHASRGLEMDTLVIVPPHASFKLTRIRITNRDGRARRLSLTSYARLVLGPEAASSRAIVTWRDPASGALLARGVPFGGSSNAVAFAATLGGAAGERLSFTADREAFLGRGGSPRAPAALATGHALDGRTGAGLDPCFAERIEFSLPPGGARDITMVLGEARSPGAARVELRRLRSPRAVEQLETETRAFWAERHSRLRIETPLPAIDLMVNGWLPYQALACRLWARSAFYQSGGAFGFRDQLQDALAFLPVDPALAREQILLHAAHQFVEGDVLHWWHPPSGRGLRTRFADDLLWLPYAAAQYIEATGDRAILTERVPFLSARTLRPGEDEAFLAPRRARVAADLYEHCCRALDRSLEVGAHGLPLFGSGDWNDGMNRVGREGRGESVWMAFFLCAVLEAFLPHVRDRSDPRAERYAGHRSDLAHAAEQAGWDGEWYRRGYYDDGTPLGSRGSDECRIDALVQAWSVISNAAPRARASAAMDALERMLLSEADGILRLLDPPFDRTQHDPGYIKGYVPGVRENGGQYTHAALWAARALAELGRGDRAARLLEMLSPIAHARDAAGVERYRVEPYVVAADVYGAAPHVGRGGWTWYTGSAGWMVRVVVESLLGVRIEGGRTLVARPAIPGDWPGFRLTLRPGGDRTQYDLHVENAGPAGAVRGASLDGHDVPVDGGAARIPLERDGRTHQVRVRMG